MQKPSEYNKNRQRAGRQSWTDALAQTHQVSSNLSVHNGILPIELALKTSLNNEQPGLVLVFKTEAHDVLLTYSKAKTSPISMPPF